MTTSTVLTSAQQHFLHGEFDRSITDFHSALEQGADADKVHLPLGLAHLKNSDFTEAIKYFSHALDLHPSDSHTLFLRGMAHFNNGNPGKAVDDFNGSIELEEGRGMVYVARSLALGALNRPIEADRDLQAAVALGDVEAELFMREYCIAPSLYTRALALFDAYRSSWGMQWWDRHTDELN